MCNKYNWNFWLIPTVFRKTLEDGFADSSDTTNDDANVYTLLLQLRGCGSCWKASSSTGCRCFHRITTTTRQIGSVIDRRPRYLHCSHSWLSPCSSSVNRSTAGRLRTSRRLRNHMLTGSPTSLLHSRGELSCSALPVALPFYLTELRKVGA